MLNTHRRATAKPNMPSTACRHAAIPLFLPALLIMMAVKFVIVVSYFMHLKFDNKLFSWMFYAGLFLAVGVYVAALGTFHFFLR
ncbi:MAG: hypothetical protein EBT73_02155 [Actinobacteria bacterium]|nr:hypothetical protein [Actinomycetota bacterium]